MLILDEIRVAKAIFYYRNSHYILEGNVETDDHGNFKMFHSHWGDDLAEKLSYPIIINK